MSIVVRFPPSPTGFLHIGNARTALFNWLFARHHGGKFLLRIEDTDRARYTKEAVEAIFDGLRWLELDWDGDVVSQFERADRHVEAAKSLLDKGLAYHCYASVEELEAMREEQKAKGLPQRYDGRWRDRDPSEAPAGVPPVVRLKAPLEGETTFHDLVRGDVTVPNSQMDDMVLLRADGSPTYMLSVVIDDHDFGITHVMRGDDHFTNTFRQIQIYHAFGWDLPVYCHLPMILGPDGAKLSKRHGAPAVDDYRKMGYLPETMRNYLMRLGWGHGDDEIISTEQAIAWFDTDGIGKAPARFDFTKLENLNAHYIREAADDRLAGLLAPFVEAEIGRALTSEDRDILMRGLPGLKSRARTLIELASSAKFYLALPPADEKARALLAESSAMLGKLAKAFEVASAFDAASLESIAREISEADAIKLGAVAQPLRAALTGSTVSPPIFEVASVLGREEVLARLHKALVAEAA
jgi:glutamyl-tRNA synthetase